MRVIFYTAAILATLASYSNAVKLNEAQPYYEFAQDDAAPAKPAKAEKSEAAPATPAAAPAKKAPAAAPVKSDAIKVTANASTGDITIEAGDKANTDAVIAAAKEISGKASEF